MDPQTLARVLQSGAPNDVDGGRTLASLSGGPGGMFGYPIRRQLYPGELSYFQANPNVAGMASETNDVILNPYSPATVDRNAVARNEAFRLHLQNLAMTPAFAVTAQQRQSFAGTPYENNETPLRETIAARMYSGDPSARATPEQLQWLRRFLGM
jgi:hypothetical protein